MVGTGTRRSGLWYLDKECSQMVYAASLVDKEKQAMIHSCRMWHVSFDKIIRIFSRCYVWNRQGQVDM
jgi:hypothetical protein